MGMEITSPFLSGAARENEMGVRGALNPTIYWVINFLVRIPFVSLQRSTALLTTNYFSAQELEFAI